MLSSEIKVIVPLVFTPTTLRPFIAEGNVGHQQGTWFVRTWIPQGGLAPRLMLFSLGITHFGPIEG